jgi:uncharacterized protein YeaO (DUF488 family)
MLKTKRVYAPREKSDGARILVMRLWPRGIRRGQVDEWNRELAPSRELLTAFKHEGLSWEDYARRYWREIRPEALGALRRRARRETLTLLCSCEDESQCHRGLLRDALSRRRASSGSRAPGARPRARRGGRPAARS